MHEHQRPDRNKYLEYDQEEVDKFTEMVGCCNVMRFPKVYANDYGEYDYASIMHYDFGQPKKPFVGEKINGIMVTRVEQNVGLSQRDVEGIKKLYKK